MGVLAKDVFSPDGLKIILSDLKYINDSFRHVDDLMGYNGDFAHCFYVEVLTQAGYLELKDKLKEFAWRQELHIDIIPDCDTKKSCFFVNAEEIGIVEEREFILKGYKKLLKSSFLMLQEDEETVRLIKTCTELLSYRKDFDWHGVNEFSSKSVVKNMLSAANKLLFYEETNSLGQVGIKEDLHYAIKMLLPFI